MALVKKLQRIDKQRNSVHHEVQCTYSIFTDVLGEKILQIDTYGSANREYRGRNSQTIQLNKETAEELVRVITTEFL